MSRSGVLNLLLAAAVIGVAATWVTLDPTAGAPEFLFGSVVLLAVAAVLRQAVRAGRRAVEENTRATRLASLPEAEIARSAVAVERVRLASDVQAVVRSAAIAMGDSAEEALRQWDGDPLSALRAIQDHGARAGMELRRLLGLLREADAEADVHTPAEAPAAAARVSRGDVVLAGVATLLGGAEAFAHRSELPAEAWGPFTVILTACAAATVVLRGVAPDLGAVLCGLLVSAGIWTDTVSSGFWLLLTPGTLTWAAVGRGLRGVLAVGVLAAGIGIEMAVRDPDNLFVAMLTLATAAVGGTVVRVAETWGRSARARADRRTAELDAAAERAIRSERLAVARELHDLVSHAVGVMVMQAGAALATRDTDPNRARRALEVVRRTAAETLDELDRLIQVLDDGVLGAPVAGPDGHDLVALVERLRAAGLAVSADLADAISAEIGAVVYRVVQESLTNVIRHAPGASAVVRVRTGPAGVDVEVVDDGPGPGTQPRRGYGLVGIEERVLRLGGEFDAGPGPGGRGFRVHARVPARARSEA